MALYYTVRRENGVLGKGFISIIDDFNLLRVCDHPDEVIDVVHSWYIELEKQWISAELKPGYIFSKSCTRKYILLPTYTLPAPWTLSNSTRAKS
jgi:hypothetical protein